jgi:5-methylcytosine-specific restriction endonuclease McrA
MSNAVWNKYIGRDKANGQCFDCKRVINVQHFECGHLKSHKNGGTTDLENLRPFCSECNRLLGSANFTEKSKKPSVDEKVIKEVEKKLNKEEDDDLEEEIDFK